MSHTIVGGEFRTSPRLPPLRSPPPDDLPAPSENVVRLSPQRRREQLSDAYRMPAERPPRRTLHLPVASASGRVNKRTDPLAAFGYRTLGPIAAGAFSTVVRAQRLEGDRREVAVKSFNRAKYNKQGWLKTALKNELDVLRALQVGHHANVANLLDVHEAHSATHAILEYCGGGSVHRHLRSLRHGHAFSEPFGTLLTAQVCEALAHLHSLGIAHRDVKAENVLYSDTSKRVVKLCDYGFSVICHDRKLRTVCGSPAYMAPELASREAYFGRPVDLWALGCFAFEVLHGVPPFRGESLDALQLRIKRVDHHKFRPSLSSEGKKLIKQLLVVEPHQRASARDAAQQWTRLNAALHMQLGGHSPITVNRDGDCADPGAPAPAPVPAEANRRYTD